MTDRIHAERLGREPLAGGISAEEFKLAFRNHPAGVAVITADAGSGPVALTATSVFSVSAEPPILVFSVADASSSTPTIISADSLVVHLIDEDALPIAKLGATRGVDRFADTAIWSRLPTGEPYFTGVKAWIRGRIVDELRAGTSTLVAVHALEVQLPDEGVMPTPLVHHNRTWHRLSEQSRIE